jgi:uncharacterized RDD family membrane protein YckC
MAVDIGERIGFGPRLGAAIIDIILIIIGGLIIGTLLGGILGGIFGSTLGPIQTEEGAEISGAQFGGGLGMLLGAAIFIPVFATLYALLEGFVGATIGKMILGLKIGNDDGTKAGVGKLLLRYAIKNIASLVSVVAAIIGVAFLQQIGSVLGLIIFIGCFLTLGSAKQALHDMIAKTAVYPKKSLG